MKYYLSEGLIKRFKKLKRDNPVLLNKVKKQLMFFEINENHPSLRNHKLKGDMTDLWSISIDMNFRLIYYIKNNEAYFFIFGTHDEVYEY